MAEYPDITNRGDLDETLPASGESASKIDDAIRQTRQFIKDHLDVSFDEDGTLKVDAISSTDMLADGIVTSEKIGSGEVTGTHIAGYPDGVDNPNLNDNSVNSRVLADNAVEEDNIKDGAVATDKLADEAVTTAKLADEAVTADKLSGSIVDAKISTLNGSKLVDGTITADKIAVDAGLGIATPGLLAIADATGSSQLAKIGGILSASIVAGSPPTLEFAFAGGATDSSSIGVMHQVTTGNMAVGLNTRSLSRVYGDTIVGSTSNIEILQAGGYLLIFGALGFSCGEHQACITNSDGTTLRISGRVAYAPIGHQTESLGVGFVEITTPGTVLKLVQYAAVAKATNGQGRQVGAVGYGSSPNEVTAWVLVIKG